MLLTYMQLKFKGIGVSIELALDKEACSLTLERMIDMYSDREKQEKQVSEKSLKYQVETDVLLTANHKVEIVGKLYELEDEYEDLIVAIQRKYNLIQASRKTAEYINDKDYDGMMNLICTELNLDLQWKEDTE